MDPPHDNLIPDGQGRDQHNFDNFLRNVERAIPSQTLPKYTREANEDQLMVHGNERIVPYVQYGATPSTQHDGNSDSSTPRSFRNKS